MTPTSRLTPRSQHQLEKMRVGQDPGLLLKVLRTVYDQTQSSQGAVLAATAPVPP